MMNKKGQVLVVFILLLPLIILFLGLVIDIGNSMVVRKKYENIIKETIIYNAKEELSLIKIEKTIKKNIKEYDELKVTKEGNTLKVNISYYYKSIFGNLFNIGLNKISIEVKYDILEGKIIKE